LRKKSRILWVLGHLPPRSVILTEDETDLLLFPPLRASWSRRGKPNRIVLSGWNAKRVLFGTLNVRTGHRLSLVRSHSRANDFRSFLDLIRRSYPARHGVVWLDESSGHKAHLSKALADRYPLHLEWLPKRSPHLNPMDHLWRDAKGGALANG
jgi:hypothetical protein